MALPRACGSPRCVWLQIGNGESLCRSGSPSPTHVGMDRRSRTSGPLRFPKPHARGDGPGARMAESERGDQAPRTWGWTEENTTSTGIVNPSPTHVGMDRHQGVQPPDPIPKPHARGDGPTSGGVLTLSDDQAPRTWGWTEPPPAPSGAPSPSPTHVGMDRVSPDTPLVSGAKPHARGDGPSGIEPKRSAPSQAPRTWGWTGHHETLGQDHGPSPTHVGMDRQFPALDAWFDPEPHARGDGP